MTTSGELISKAIRDTAGEGIQAIHEAAGSVKLLALAVNNLARTLDKQTPEDDPDDGEPVRQPARAFPRMNPAVRTR